MIKKEVYSFNSRIKILKSKFDDALKCLQDRHLYKKELKDATTLRRGLEICGWKPKTNFDGHICALEYMSDKWDFSYETSLKYIAQFIEPGSKMYMANELGNLSPNYWVYKFDGNTMERNILKKEFIDYESEEQLLNLFIQVSRNLIRLGVSSKRLKFELSKLFIESIVN